MSERHDRSVRSTLLTILEYAEEIEALLSKVDEFNESVSGRLSPEDSKAVEAVLNDIGEVIRKYWGEAGLRGNDLNVRWRIFVMAEFMESLLYDVRPERLGKTHGEIESAEQAKQLGKLCDDLYIQVKQLKDISLKK